MISFKPICDGADIASLVGVEIPKEEQEYVAEILSSLVDSEDVEYAVSFAAGCLLLRIFDTGRYLFAFPFEIGADADLEAAISLIGEYAMREELPLVFVDVPREALPLLSVYRHMNLDAEDAEGESFRVAVKTECALCDQIPEVSVGRVTLTPIFEADIADFARLCRDEEVNKFWGYDYREDISAPADEYFYENASLEFKRGLSISSAIRVDGVFAGEATLYAFDGKGGAEFATRLLPEFWGRGLGTESTRAAMEMARRIGLITLTSRILEANEASISMLSKITNDSRDDGDAILFIVKLK